MVPSPHYEEARSVLSMDMDLLAPGAHLGFIADVRQASVGGDALTAIALALFLIIE